MKLIVVLLGTFFEVERFAAGFWEEEANAVGVELIRSFGISLRRLV